jgi:hypothetical protein
VKNIQVIDSADNCGYWVYRISDSLFERLFPGSLQDIEFVEAIVEREGESGAGELLRCLWDSRIDKKEVDGIHGTLFFDLSYKAIFYPNMRETDLDNATLQGTDLKMRAEAKSRNRT